MEKLMDEEQKSLKYVVDSLMAMALKELEEELVEKSVSQLCITVPVSASELWAIDDKTYGVILYLEDGRKIAYQPERIEKGEGE